MNRKLITISTIITLAILHFIGRDQLAFKLDGFLTKQIGIIHFVAVPTIGYFISNHFSKNSTNKFLVLFFIINAYSIYSFTNSAISNRLVNKEIRHSLNSKIVKLDYAGWGYEIDSMNLREYEEINNGYYPNLPIGSINIFLYEWYEFDARHEVEFTAPYILNLKEFYKSDTSLLNEIQELKLNDFAERHKIVNGKIVKEYGKQMFDTISQKRYKWKRSFE